MQVPGVPVIILTAFGSIESAVELMKQGAYDYLRKPFQAEDLVFRVEKAVEKFKLEEELRIAARDDRAARAGTRHRGHEPRDPRSVLSQIEMVAGTDYPVLIQGESGTGKELVARAIHQRSQRARKKFVTVNCGGDPRDAPRERALRPRARRVHRRGRRARAASSRSPTAARSSSTRSAT